MDWNYIQQWFHDPVHLIDATSTLLGLLYLYLEYKAKIWLWAVSIIMPAIRSYIFLKKGIYADFGMQFFYISVAIYGFLSWKYGKKQSGKKEVLITHFPAKMAVVAIVAFAALWAGLYLFLTRITDSTIPLIDSFTTALCIIAYWALAKKWAEQWLLWFVVDIVSTVLYFYKGIPFSGTLYLFYTVMAIVGYRKWLQLMKTQ